MFKFFERRRQAQREHELRLAQIQADAATEQAKLQADAFERIATLQQQAAAAQAQALREMVDSLAKSLLETVTTLAEAQNKQTAVLQSWMDGFKVYEVPTSRALNDADEARIAMEREIERDPEAFAQMFAAGLPREATVAETIDWIARQIDGEDEPPARPVGAVGAGPAVLADFAR